MQTQCNQLPQGHFLGCGRNVVRATHDIDKEKVKVLMRKRTTQKLYIYKEKLKALMKHTTFKQCFEVGIYKRKWGTDKKVLD